MFSLLFLSFCKINCGEIISNISIENNREIHFGFLIEPVVKFEYEEHINNTEINMRNNFSDYDFIMLTDWGECFEYDNSNTVTLNINCEEETLFNMSYDEFLLNHEVYFKRQHSDFITKLNVEGECFGHEFPDILLFNVNCLWYHNEQFDQDMPYALLALRHMALRHMALRHMALRHMAYLYIYNLDGLGEDFEWEEFMLNETITYYEHKDKNRNHVYEDKVKVLTRFLTLSEFVGDRMYRKKLALLRDRFLEKNSTQATNISNFLKLKQQPLIFYNNILFGTWEVYINLFTIILLIVPKMYTPHYLKIFVIFEIILFAFFILE